MTLPLNPHCLLHGKPSGGAAGSWWHTVRFKPKFLTVRNRLKFFRAPRLPPFGASAYILIVDPGQTMIACHCEDEEPGLELLQFCHSVDEGELLLVFKTRNSVTGGKFFLLL